MEQNKAHELCAKFSFLKGSRQNWDNIWQDLSDNIMPRKGDFNTIRAKGERRNHRLYDATATMSCEQLASALVGYTCSPTEKWFSLAPTDNEQYQDEELIQWLQECEKLIYKILQSPKTNFYPQAHEFFVDVVNFGTAILNIEENVLGVPIRFYSTPLSQCYIMENALGQIDTVFRQFNWSAKNVLERFDIKDEQKISKLEELIKRDPNHEIVIVHAVHPRSSPLFQGLYAEKNKMPFASCYLWHEEKYLLSESGFMENPYSVGRWNRLPGEVYGRGPAETALPDVMMLQAMSKTLLVGAQKSIDPPLQVIHDGFIGQRINVNPGAINYIKRSYGDNRGIEPINFGAQVQIGFEFVRAAREQIQKAFMLDMLADDKKAEMTATETIQREQARMRVMAPQLGRLHSEFFGPLINRIFNICRRQGLIPDPPVEVDIKIDYVSPLARSQKLMEFSQIQSFLQQVIPYGQIDPEVLQAINTRELLEIAAEANNVPRQVIHSKEDLQAIKDKKEQQQQAQQMSDMAAQDSTSLKNMGQLIQMSREQAA